MSCIVRFAGVKMWRDGKSKQASPPPETTFLFIFSLFIHLLKDGKLRRKWNKAGFLTFKN